MANIADRSHEISIQSTDDSIEPSDKAVFDAETAGISFRQWIGQLTPMHLLDSPSVQMWPF